MGHESLFFWNVNFRLDFWVVIMRELITYSKIETANLKPEYLNDFDILHGVKEEINPSFYLFFIAGEKSGRGNRR